MERGNCVIMRTTMAQTDLPRIFGCSSRLIREGREERMDRTVPEAAAQERARRMRELKSGLSAIVGDHCVGLRPFVCDGSPLDCRVFLVGINPATEMSGNFWDFWDDDSGFNKEKWRERYDEERDEGRICRAAGRSLSGLLKPPIPFPVWKPTCFPRKRGARTNCGTGKSPPPLLNSCWIKLIGRASSWCLAKARRKRKKALCAVKSALGPLDSVPDPVPEPFGAFGGGEELYCGRGVYMLFVRPYIRWGHEHAREFGERLREKCDV